ncbi:hypothetical protein F4775DRAFT_555537 [Biscogniauxia sp. FL1348]|nr:hypothetical protein F4775DRAFT_555537 [Biscogniauxia sp. FL1348]
MLQLPVVLGLECLGSSTNALGTVINPFPAGLGEMTGSLGNTIRMIHETSLKAYFLCTSHWRGFVSHLQLVVLGITEVQVRG